jgi:hypothetical protein
MRLRRRRGNNMSIVTRLYEHSNLAGRSSLHTLSYYVEFRPIPTYARIEKSALEAWNMHDKASSLETFAHDYEQGGYTILFQHDRYRGRFVMLPCTPGQTLSTPALSSLDFNDRTSSALLVRRFSVECPPLPISSLMPTLGAQVTSIFIENAFPAWAPPPGADAAYSPRGDPKVTWDMWPSFSPTRTYVYLRIPLRENIWGWFDYDLELRFWIYFYIDTSGTLRGYVDWYGLWVEGGFLTESILERTIGEVGEIVPEVNSLILEATSPWEPFSFARLYYLPGRATPTGRVDEDVSLVLVKEL